MRCRIHVASYLGEAQTGKLQTTLKSIAQVTGKCLHSGKISTVTLSPELAGKGRTFHFPHANCSIPGTIDFVCQSLLCTTLQKDSIRLQTVEHLLSALEGAGVSNCSIEVTNSNTEDTEFEIPILDGSAKQWTEKIQNVGVGTAVDGAGNHRQMLAPHLLHPVRIRHNDSFLFAFPSTTTHITYGIDFPKVQAIGNQWFSWPSLTQSSYADEIAPSRTFCVYEQIESMKKKGLIKGGSLENAIVCSEMEGLLNPPLRYVDEPCRHKVLDLVGDLSLFARCGNNGVPVAHIVAYKAGHALHTQFLRCLESLN